MERFLNPAQVSPAEKKWIKAFCLFTAVAISLPYLVAEWKASSEWVFTGHLLGVEDGNTYIAKMLSGSAGAWLFRSPYTSFPQAGAWLYLPYILLGKLAAPPGMHAQLVILFHLFRIAGIMVYTWGTYQFLSIFLRDPRQRKLGLTLASFGGGLGWLLILLGEENILGSLPLDVYSPETFGFLAIYALPHLAFARGLMMLAFASFLGPPRNAGSESQHAGQLILKGIPTGIFLLLVGLFQPLTVVLSLGILGIYFLFVLVRRRAQENSGDVDSPRKLFWRGIGAGLVSSPLVVYSFWVFQVDPYLQHWTAQNLILSPHPIHYVFAYGLIFPFALIGVIRAFRGKVPTALFLVAWIVALPFLLYFPLNLQRRLAEGAWTAWIVLAFWGVDELTRERILQKPLNVFPCLWKGVLPLFFGTTVFILATGWFGAIFPAHPAFRTREEVRSFEFLARNCDPGDVVLTAYPTGNALPAWAPVRVIIGHGPESVGLADLDREIKRWFSLKTPEIDRVEFLKTHNVRFVYYGAEEQDLGEYDPGSSQCLKLIYDADGIQIYEVYR